MKILKQVSRRGKILVLCFFLLYINDLPKCLDSSEQALFAGDTNLTISGATAMEIQDNLEIELNKVHTWLLANKLTLNANRVKTTVVSNYF